MANSHTNIKANRGGEFNVSATTTDSPILPIEQIDRLRQIAPERVEWVFEQTQIEAEARRHGNRRVNLMIFIERMAGLVFALLIAIIGLGAAVYLAMHDKEIVASILGGGTLVSLVATFVAGRTVSAKEKPPEK